jgi:hypothetical protein
VAAAAVVIAVAFGPLVRAKVRAVAAQQGLDIEIGSVRPGWFAVRLLDVRAQPASLAGVRLAFPEIRVALSAFLAPKEVAAMGGQVALAGSVDELRSALEVWRGRRRSTSSGKSSNLILHGEGISIEWRRSEDLGTPFLEATGLAVTRDGAGVRIGLDHGRLKSGSLGLELGDAELAFDPTATLRTAKIATASVLWEPKAPETVPAASAQSAVDTSPPPLPGVDRRKGAGTAAPSDASIPLLPLPQLHVLRAAVVSAASTLSERLPEGGSVEIAGFSFRLEEEREHLSLGPGSLSVDRSADQIGVSFSTSPVANGTPLSLHAQVPTDDRDVEVSLAGGPVSLSLLGVKEGAAGLTEVKRATVAGKGRVVLEGHGQSLTFDSELSVRGLAIREARLANDTVRGLDIGLSARGVLSDQGELRLDDAEATLGALHLNLRGGLEQATDHVAAAVQFDVPTADCSAVLGSVPTAFLPTVSTARMAGTIGGSGRLAFDTRKLEDLALDYSILDRCKMIEVPEELAKERFSKEFSHRIYLDDGTVSEEDTGPGTTHWTDLDGISRYMQVAVLTTEDGAFFHHHGYNHAAIRNALIANLKARRFVRGASTITMQLAKNLFLSREKTVARKLEELVLTDYLEQIFTKDEMMELYLNIIEFGPNLYGITAAADHYFGRRPDELNLAECLFLSSILPQPLHYHKLWEKGAVPDSWMRGLHDRMELAHRLGTITAAELADGLSEPVVFWHADQARPTPRAGTPGAKREYDEAEWQQLN